jgi:NAD(P)-dependent dehydrogenase (short-subunit alcohol dehydrogenase family)
MQFKDKLILITEAARGIGKTFAEAFTKKEVKVIIADIDFDQVQQTAKEVRENVLFGSMGLSSYLVGIALFLESNEANYNVAQTYNVEGGQWMN